VPMMTNVLYFSNSMMFTTIINIFIITVVATQINASFSFVLKSSSLTSRYNTHNYRRFREVKFLSSVSVSNEGDEMGSKDEVQVDSVTININEGEGEGEDGDDEDQESLLRFKGVGRLYEQQQSSSNPSSSPQSYNEILSRLRKSTVAIIGIGGVGSWAAESICRSGIGNIILLDLDDVCISNTNRQLHATSSSIGQMKTDVMKKRLLDINPNCNITLIHDFISEDNVFDIVQGFQSDENGENGVDVIIDAIDGHVEKAALIAAACIKNIPIVTCGGAAGRIDPTQIICEDLSDSIECKLLFWTKKKLRNHYRLFPNDNKKKNKRSRKWRIPAIYSKEQQKKVDEDISTSSFRKCDGALGTACFVTGTYGMVAASKAITMLANDDFSKPRIIKSSVKHWNDVHDEFKKQKELNCVTDNINTNFTLIS
jgi:tRNA A37 threonylcarbamoyladenosine dehydratase